MVHKFPKYFDLDIGGRVEAVSADRLKPYLGRPDVTPALPPRRGRPPLMERTISRRGPLEAEDSLPE